MRKDLQKRVLETIARHGMIRPGDRLGMGVSGGADSVALLRMFAEFSTQLGVTLFVLHLHHQLRGAEADEDERFVKSLAEAFHLEFESGRADVAAEAKIHGWNLEDAARRLRYGFFSSVASARGLNRVAVAHNANDQAETVLSHLLRGTGLAGLAGIYPVAGLIVRPLLEIGRGELREYLSGLGQPWREDTTNQDTSRTRARIRRELIPLFVRDFDPDAVTHLTRLATHAREEEAFWRVLEDERFHMLAARDSSGAILVAIKDLLAPLPLIFESPAGEHLRGEITPRSEPAIALTRRLVRRIYAELRGSREQLTSQHVESVIHLATKSQSGAKIDLPGIRVERIFNQLRFENVPASPVQACETGVTNHDFAYMLARPRQGDGISVVVAEIHRRISLKRVDWPLAGSETVRGGGALDYDRVQWPLVLRNWRPGDSYCPHGSRRVRKLKRLLLESRVPRGARGNWPVLTSGGKVIWAAGYPVAENLVPGGKTRLGLIIDEEEL